MLSDMLQTQVTQEQFGEAVGISQQAVSAMVSEGAIPRGVSFGAMLRAYCSRLREQAAGRLGGEVGGLDLVQERAALTREQRLAQEMKNQVARGEFAPIGLLANILGKASGAVANRFDQIEGALRKIRPDIDEELLAEVVGVVTAARNEWVRSTAKLVDEAIDSMAEDMDESGGDL